MVNIGNKDSRYFPRKPEAVLWNIETTTIGKHDRKAR